MHASPQVLMVSDRTTERHLICALLNAGDDAAYDLSTCESGDELRSQLHTRNYDVILLATDRDELRQVALAPWLCNLPLGGPQLILLLRDNSDASSDTNAETHAEASPASLNFSQLTSPRLISAIDTALQRRRNLRDKLRSEIAHALLRGEMELRYQPVLDLRRGILDHVEVLLRWRHPLYGLMGPGHFLDIAESSGAIHPLGIWTLRRAREQQRQWLAQGLPRIPLSINVSDAQLERDNFAQAVAASLPAGNSETLGLGFEISAAGLARCSGAARSLLSEWHRRGIDLTADNVGAEQQAAPLQGLPLDALKLDHSLIDRCEQDPTMLKSMLQLGQSLGCDTIAAGVERRDTVDFLRQQRCDHLQGFGVARPLSGAEIVAWTQQWMSRSGRARA